MGMPQPSLVHDQIARFAGDWEGDEQLSPSPWAPEGGEAAGRYSNTMILDGFYLLLEYEQRRGDEVNFRGHGLIGWDALNSRYALHWFDSTGFVPAAPALGTWSSNGDELALAAQSPEGHHRYVWTLGDGEFRMRIENSEDGSTWETFLDGTYKKR